LNLDYCFGEMNKACSKYLCFLTIASLAKTLVACAIVFAFSPSVLAQVRGGQPQPGQEPRAPALPITTKTPAIESRLQDSLSRSAAPNFGAPAAILDRVEFEPDVFFQVGKVAPAWQARLGILTSSEELHDIADAVAQHLDDIGFVSPVVYPVAFSKGVARFKVLKGRIMQIRIVGDPRDNRHLIKRMAEELLSASPLTFTALQRQVLLINDLPGLYVTAVVNPLTLNTGDLELELNVSQVRQFGRVAAHNRTSRVYGRVRSEADIAINSAIGWNEQHYLSASTDFGGRLHLFGYSFQLPLNIHGLRLEANSDYSRSNPDLGDRQSDFSTRFARASLGLAFPIMRRYDQNLSIHGWLTTERASSRDGTGRNTRDKINSLRVGLKYDLVDPFNGTNVVEFDMYKGLSTFGASRDGDIRLSRTDSEPQYFKATTYFGRLQRISEQWSLLVAATTQFTNNRLPPAEQFATGGDLIMRAYDNADFAGDRGYAIKVEPRRNFSVSGVDGTIYSFYDYVHVRLLGQGGVREKGSSVGLGLRATLGRSATGYIEVAKPHGKDVIAEGSRAARVFGGLSWTF
jgi:hemolysin activation/secretion protein